MARMESTTMESIVAGLKSNRETDMVQLESIVVDIRNDVKSDMARRLGALETILKL